MGRGTGKGGVVGVSLVDAAKSSSRLFQSLGSSRRLRVAANLSRRKSISRVRATLRVDTAQVIYSVSVSSPTKALTAGLMMYHANVYN